MKPLNLDNSPCSPTSSNCVIWAGPDIPCIKLCKGDTVSDVVFKLATELCQILDTLDIANYDLSCFNITSCAPSDFEALINFLIQKICALENIPTSENNTGGTGCPTDCIVAVADCLAVSPGQVLNLVDYVNLIATRVCNLATDISILQSAVNVLQNDVTALQITVAGLSNYTTPEFAITCTIGTLTDPNTYPINEILEEFINSVWCPMNVALVGASGTAGDLSNAVASQCTLDTDTALVNQYTSPTTMAIQYAGIWVSPAVSIADAIRNLWVALCDVRNAELMEYAVTTSDDITVTTSVVGAMTTFDIGRTPKINYYAESTTALYLQNSVAPQAYVDSQYFQPNSYTTLGFTNTSGATKDFFIRVSYDTNVQLLSQNSVSIINEVDGALILNGNVLSPLYQSLGNTNVSGSLFDGPLASDVVNIGTTETVVTTPGILPVEFRFLNGGLPRNVSFFKKVTLNNGEIVQLMFRSKGGSPTGYLLQAQFYVEEIR